MKFYDREDEITILKENELQSRKSAVFTVLMGRKRVGKTTLITGIRQCVLYGRRDGLLDQVIKDMLYDKVF